MDFRNSTTLDDKTLYEIVTRHTAPWRHDRLTVRFRYSRSTPFSGACYYRDSRIFVNLGRRNRYPYSFGTHVARARSTRTHWWREIHRITVADAYQLGLFIYLHELFHYLVKASGRSTRQKEAKCDRFAARVLVDHYGCSIQDRAGRPVERSEWDFQDLDRFVEAAPKDPQLTLLLQPGARPAAEKTRLAQIPVRVVG